MKEILKKLCIDRGVSGSETEMLDVIKELVGDFAEVSADGMGDILVTMGDKNSSKHIMFDAHIDRIGLVVTYINDEGFIKAEPVGGIDLRTLQSSAVKVLAKENILGVVCTMPPHLSKNDDELSKDKIWIDTGLSADEVKDIVSLGDKIIVCSEFRELLNNQVAVSALDNRAGCAVLVKCAEILKDKEIPCKLSLVFSVQEETSELGAGISAYSLEPDEAVVIDVGFAKQDGVPDEKSGKIGCGAIISISPVLSKQVTDKIKEIAKSLSMECDYEVCGGATGTNADKISSSRGGVPTGCISVPEKNMHTQVEVVSLDDMEKIAELLAIYAENGGAFNA